MYGITAVIVNGSWRNGIIILERLRLFRWASRLSFFGRITEMAVKCKLDGYRAKQEDGRQK